jgi:uncharacterized protein (DUF1684 family)
MQKLIILVLLISLTACSKKKETFDDFTASVKDFQYNLNKEYADSITSPLTKDDLKNFKALDFFPIDSTYKITAKFIRTPDEEPFEMTTTTSRKSIEVKYGEVHFTLKDTILTLNVYQNLELKLTDQYKNYLFLPFTDKTNGKESYGGGRYIGLEIPKGDTIIIDFNKAYNPYCAYNHKYSCPIPPRENDLPIAIKAGVKSYKGH